MWNENIPAAFRYQPSSVIWEHLLKYPHTLPKDGVLPARIWKFLQQPTTGWFFETSPYDNTQEFIAKWNAYGLLEQSDPNFYTTGAWIGVVEMAWYFTAQDRSSIVYYYTPALQKIARIIQGYDVGYDEPKKRLNDIKNYSVITSRMTNFMRTTLNYDVDPMRIILNKLKKDGFVEPSNIFPRLQNIQNTFRINGVNIK